MKTADAADTLQAYDEARARRNSQRFSPLPPGPIGESWKPVLTDEERQEREQRIKEFNLPF